MSPEKKAKLAELSNEAWECVSLAPPACYWPDCGCDPYATEIIRVMVDDGWEAPINVTPAHLTINGVVGGVGKP